MTDHIIIKKVPLERNKEKLLRGGAQFKNYDEWYKVTPEQLASFGITPAGA
jgi:hypothetical protein